MRGLVAANRSRQAVFLGYHSVTECGPRWLSLPPELFERQLALLRRRGYATGNVDALRALARGERPARPSAFLTFDDGFADNHSIVAPLLRHYGFSAFIFVLPPLLETGGPLAWAELEEHRRHHPDVMRSLTWRQVEDLTEAGLTIGSHTMSHRRLSELDAEERTQELLDSRRVLARHLGRCETLAYPFGDWDASVARAAARAGYSWAFTMPETGQLRAHRLGLPRIAVDHRDTERRFVLKLSTAGRQLLLSPLKAFVRGVARGKAGSGA
ncbi:MAG: polysaccharide deacetylase family protein [Actinomycetota bacterium]|nr:polysaccharide deacetylase family protein [Actinomycetota bacterium]